MEENKVIKPEPKLILNNNLSTVWIDGFNIGIRTDNLALIRLLTNLPEGSSEQYKFICTQDSLKSLIDLLCPMMDYFPVKAKPVKQKRQKKSV